MIKSAVTIALVAQIKTGPWIFWDDLEISMDKAARLGFDGVELFTSSADAIEAASLQTLLKNTGLSLAAVGTGAGKVLHGFTLTDPDPHIRRQAVSFITEMISFGARFGAPAIIGSMQGNTSAAIGREQSLEWLSEGLTLLGRHAEANHVKLIYEPLNRYETNLFNTLAEAAAFIDSLKTANVCLLADLFHMNIEETSLAESIRQYSHHIGHVHFADSNRRPMGFGHTAMPEIALALQQTGYRGYVSAEAFPWPDPDQAARQTIKSFKQYFRRK